MSRKPVVLFLCSRNSARSQLAEGLLRHLAGNRFEAQSAGTVAGGVHPLAVRALEEIGVDASGQRSKTLDEALEAGHPDFLVTVCARAAASCPALPGFAGTRLDWPFDDPAAVTGDETQRLDAFRRARDSIRRRILDWLEEQ